MPRGSGILPGGGGTRFWPLSRQSQPTQLLNLSGSDILLNDTIDRTCGVVPLENTVVATNRGQAAKIAEVIRKGVPPGNILGEPAGRNTAACILYAALHVMKKYGDSVMAVLPSDPYISDVAGYRAVLGDACDAAAATGKLVTIGIKPGFVSTAYGYIRRKAAPLSAGAAYGAGAVTGAGGGGAGPAGAAGARAAVYEAAEFVEKPGYETAKRYVESGEYLWNSGMFIWKASVILENFERYLPRLYHAFQSAAGDIGGPGEAAALDAIYAKLPSISIDYGIMERSDEVLLLEGDFGWSDVGSWDALGAIYPPDELGNVVHANTAHLDTRGSVIYGEGQKRLIAAIGVNNLIIADTPDAVLVCPMGRAQDVRALVDLLREKGLTEYL
jgi:mannose-1-phosphate guanylyltransferase